MRNSYKFPAVWNWLREISKAEEILCFHSVTPYEAYTLVIADTPLPVVNCIITGYDPEYLTDIFSVSVGRHCFVSGEIDHVPAIDPFGIRTGAEF